MPAPTFSVIVPTYNGARYLGATLDSLVAQRSVDIEVIVVDDGSTDTTLDVVAAHALAPRVVHQANSGVAVARNRGLALARGDYVAFLDQDDLWHPDRLAAVGDFLSGSKELAVATGETAFADPADRQSLEAVGDGRHLWPSVWVDESEEQKLLFERVLPPASPDKSLSTRRFLLGPATVTTSVVYDRTTAIAAGGCATHAKAVDDHVLNVAVSRLTGGRISLLDHESVLYRVHSRSTSTATALALPFLSTVLALRNGGLLVPRGRSSDPTCVGTLDETPTISHYIDQLMVSDESLLDVLAWTYLLTPAGQKTRRLARTVKRRVIGRA